MENKTPISKQLGICLPSPIEPFTPDWPGAEHVAVHIKRDDLIHPVVSGNKWRKLSPLFSAPEALPTSIVSFGGGFSNHLHALGFCCQTLNIPMTAIIRGHYHQHPTPMLKDLSRWGIHIHYVSKLEYQQRHNRDYLQQLRKRFVNALIIPEGGSQQQALAGVQHTLLETPHDFDVVISPVASGATLAGLTSALKPKQRAIGIAVLKGVGYLEDLVRQFVPVSQQHQWCIEHGFHFGGYAKSTKELREFIKKVQSEHALPLEPVYNGKLFFALKTLLAQQYFDRNTRILVIHTGGLQGNRTIDPI